MSISENGEDTRHIAYCKIHPGIGIARLGNSADEFFIGPEAPGRPPEPSDGLFKDGTGRVKRQAVRFRIYAYDDQDNPIQEVTAEDASIDWQVHLVNKKAEWYRFKSRYDDQQQEKRNEDISNRKSLINDPGIRSISGLNQAGEKYKFDTGKCFDVTVPLGELRTDEKGRLIVLGGFGHSGSPDNTPITTYANNEHWYDDTSDGPVTAIVALKSDNMKVPVRDNAWVIVAPPKFAPYHYPIITLYDVMQQVAFVNNWLTPPDKITFTRDIYPILERAVQYRWLNASANRGHGIGTPGSFLDYMQDLADNSKLNYDNRKRVFDRLRDPSLMSKPESKEASNQASYTYMPQLSGDLGDNSIGLIRTWLTLLPYQYEKMRKWKDGDFESDWNGQPPPVAPEFNQIPLHNQPVALDRAPLETGIGGAFFPGIEMTYISLDRETYDGKPFRLSSKLEPGDITKHMALPWQADFYECSDHWWPAARPDDVIPENEYLTVKRLWDSDPIYSDPEKFQDINFLGMLEHRESWTRDLPADSNIGLMGDPYMVKYWSDLGFILPRNTPDGETFFIEAERNPYGGMNVREYFYRMTNIGSNTDFLQKARMLADDFMNEIWALQVTGEDFPSNYRFFDYSRDAFQARMDEIYKELVEQADTYDPEQDQTFKSRQEMIERTLQLAPFNQLDGVWLRNVAKGGPIDQVRSLLFEIWMDEQGDGKPDQNHANLYTELLKSLGVVLPTIDSYEYAYDKALLDSAFTKPLFELVISQFTEEYFPEILGMTLNLEWEVLGLKPVIALLRKFDIDPHFYVMHVGIDNAVNGHGAKAKEAVMLYLDQISENAGEEAVQQTWKRIWKGYITFSLVGSLSADLQKKIDSERVIENKVLAMIERKKEYGSLNHGNKTLGKSNYHINDLFDRPDKFLEQLVEQGFLIPGDPDNSPFFRRLSFDGPMYKVFTSEEINLWQNYVRSLTQPEMMKSDQAMLLLIQRVKDDPFFIDNPEHDLLITGVDLNTGIVVKRPISWWINQNQPGSLLQALAMDPQLIDKGKPEEKKGHPENSLLFTNWVSGSMSTLFEQPAILTIKKTVDNREVKKYISTGYETWKDIVSQWIEDKCPLPVLDPRGAALLFPGPSLTPKPVVKKVKHLLLEHTAAQASETSGIVMGSGNVH